MTNSLTTVILGDLHNRLNRTRKVLSVIGVLTPHPFDPMRDIRNPGFKLVQLGDAVSLGYDEEEAYFLKWFYRVVLTDTDVTLIGNHELPAIFHDPESIMFYGYLPEVDERGKQVYRLGADPAARHLVVSRYNEGKLKAATHVGKWLVTHAGVAVRYQKAHQYRDVPAELIAEDLNRRFQWCQDNYKYDDVISNASSHQGGIFWLRFEYLAGGYHEVHVPQIVGHSGYFGAKYHSPNLWNIDTPGPTKREARAMLAAGNDGLTRKNLGGVFALVTKDEGETFETYYSPTGGGPINVVHNGD